MNVIRLEDNRKQFNFSAKETIENHLNNFLKSTLFRYFQYYAFDWKYLFLMFLYVCWCLINCWCVFIRIKLFELFDYLSRMYFSIRCLSILFSFSCRCVLFVLSTYHYAVCILIFLFNSNSISHTRTQSHANYLMVIDGVSIK